MHVTTTHYEDFKRFVTGVGVAPPPLDKPDPDAPVDANPVPAPEPKGKAGPKMAGAVYHWGGTPANGAWGCALVSADFKNTVQSGSLDGVEPKTFAADFPDAVKLDGALTIS